MEKCIKLNKQLYPAESIKKAAYKYIDRFYIHLDMDENYYLIELKSKHEDQMDDCEFVNEVLAQAVRYEVYKKTHVIRELLIARAMSSTIIGELPENIGIIDSDGEKLEDILMDWFEKYENVHKGI